MSGRRVALLMGMAVIVVLIVLFIMRSTEDGAMESKDKKSENVQAGAGAASGKSDSGAVETAGKEKTARFVKRDGQNPIIIIEGSLDSITVVRVDVNISYPPTCL